VRLLVQPFLPQSILITIHWRVSVTGVKNTFGELDCAICIGQVPGLLAFARFQQRQKGIAPVSRNAVLVAAATLGPDKDAGQGVEGAAPGSGWDRGVATGGADTATLVHEQSAAEQVGPDLQPVVASFVGFGSDAHEGGGLRIAAAGRGRACSGTGCDFWASSTAQINHRQDRRVVVWHNRRRP
jgi:hypothetical protein